MGIFMLFCRTVYACIAPAVVNDMVPPCHRATANSLHVYLVTVLGLSLGPYIIGRISDAIQGRDNMNTTGHQHIHLQDISYNSVCINGSWSIFSLCSLSVLSAYRYLYC